MQIKISVLIICKNILKLQNVLNEVLALENENIEWEVLVGEGDNPSEQRNLLAYKASGDWLLFLDDDSKPSKNLLEVYRKLIETHHVFIAGGPSLVEKSNGMVGKLSQIFFGSIWGVGPYLSRYNSLGETRISNERELILCNMLVQREFFLKHGGFCSDLYPNEENEFIQRSPANGHTFYIPQAVVVRPARVNVLEFSEQLFNYGKGRFKNIYMKKNFGDYIFVAPAFFSLYLLSIPFLVMYSQIALLLPIVLYIVLTMYSGLSRIKDFKFLVFLSPFFFALGHFSYGFGVWRGVFEYAIMQKNLKLNSASFINVHQLK
jgi:glycosyltransferase involved in cell wall biosynthesis